MADRNFLKSNLQGKTYQLFEKGARDIGLAEIQGLQAHG